MKSWLILLLLLSSIALCAGNSNAAEFKLGEFNISMSPPEAIGHISYSSDTYDTFEVNKASFETPVLSYTVTILKPLAGTTAKEHRGTPIPGPSVSVLDTEIDGKPAVEVLANQYTTIEYVKDDNALITLQFKEAEGTDSSNSIAETIKSFKAMRTQG